MHARDENTVDQSEIDEACIDAYARSKVGSYEEGRQQSGAIKALLPFSSFDSVGQVREAYESGDPAEGLVTDTYHNEDENAVWCECHFREASEMGIINLREDRDGAALTDDAMKRVAEVLDGAGVTQDD